MPILRGAAKHQIGSVRLHVEDPLDRRAGDSSSTPFAVPPNDIGDSIRASERALP